MPQLCSSARVAVVLVAAVAASLLPTATIFADAQQQTAFIIHAVGDQHVAGRDVSDTRGPSFSFRRYLYHNLVARGYHVRFVGSANDCDHVVRYQGAPPLDFDSHHDGYAKLTMDEIASRINGGKDVIVRQVQEAVQAIQKEAGGASAVDIKYLTIVSAGGYDAVQGTARDHISEQKMAPLVDASLNFGGGLTKEAIIAVSPPPGGKRTKSESGKLVLQRNQEHDIRYEDYRFFLTWRGQWFNNRKIAADCFSSFDMENHYTEDGTGLNDLGDQAFADCIVQYLNFKQLVKLTMPEDAACRSSSAKTLSARGTGNAFMVFPGGVDEATSKIASETAPFVVALNPANVKKPHAACLAAADAGATTSEGEDDAETKAKKAKKAAAKLFQGSKCSKTVGLDSLSYSDVAAAPASPE